VRELAGITLACLAVLLTTPYGPGLITFPFRTLSIGVLRDFIDEWQSPNFHMIEAQVFIWLLVATLAAIGLSGKRMDLTDVLMLGAFTYLSLIAGRNIATFALVAAPVLTRHAQAGLEALAAFLGRPHWLAQNPGPAPRPINMVLNWSILGLVLIAALAKISLPLDATLNAELALRFQPVQAAQFLKQSRRAGPMFNDYGWGGYLSWTLFPDFLIYVDGRTDLYDEQFLLEYVQLANGTEQWESILARHGVRLLVIGANSPLAAQAGRSQMWTELHRDAVAVVYERTP
jgi:hypothetical protein